MKTTKYTNLDKINLIEESIILDLQYRIEKLINNI